MASGYFDGLLAFLYRETTDGRRVTSRRLLPLLRPHWLLVPPDAQPRFERRVKQAHIAGLAGVAIGIQFIPTDAPESVWFFVILAIVLVSVTLSQAWATAGLPAYDGDDSTIVPVRRLEMHERQARAMGPRTLIAFLVLSILLTIPQAIVAVQDGAWWAWLGLVTFGGIAIYFARMYARIRAERRDGRVV